MNTLRTGAFSPRPLEAVGIDETEEHAYRAVLTHRGATAEDVANMLSLSVRKAQRLLDGIESKGLVSHSPSRPRRYVAAPPELAVEALITQRVAVLERTRASIAELKEQAKSSANTEDREQVVELITSRTAVGQILVQLLQTVQSEIVGFQRAPMMYIQGFPSEVPAGVHIRSISDAGYLALPGALNSLRLDVEKGEEARIFPNLPVKLLIVDRRVGLIPLSAGDQGGTILLVRSSSLLDALYELFELIWERSTPIAFTRAGKLKTEKAGAALSDAAEQVILLLAAGLNDKAIAHEAGISAMTLSRRITELMKSFDTRTRFQLGWRAALDAFPERVTANTRGKKKPRTR
jgi:DNA-binding CsgD family transcriptional regulator